MTSLLNELLEMQDTLPLLEALEESLITASKGGKILPDMKGAKDFFKQNPVLTIAAASMAINAYAKYKQNQRNTIRLFAKDAYEKRMMTDIVDTLMKQGKFKLAKTAYADGGKVWVLKRVGL